jgi:hypothetical protein
MPLQTTPEPAGTPRSAPLWSRTASRTTCSLCLPLPRPAALFDACAAIDPLRAFQTLAALAGADGSAALSAESLRPYLARSARDVRLAALMCVERTTPAALAAPAPDGVSAQS